VEATQRILSTREKHIITALPLGWRLTEQLFRRRAVVLRARRRLGLSARVMLLATFERPVGDVPLEVARYHLNCARQWLRAAAVDDYPVLDPAAAAARRRSDTVFIFGSGWSLNEISPETWGRIAEHDTFGFNYHFRQRFVRMDFHLFRELRNAAEPASKADAIIEEFNRSLATACYADTVAVLQDGWLSELNRIVAERRLTPGTRVLRYWNRRGFAAPSESFSAGITHGTGTLTDCINIASCLGWKKIVIAGVDLYDSRYFWLDRDADREMGPASMIRTQRHPTAANGIVHLLGTWREWLDRRHVGLFNFNQKSLLSDVLPLFTLE
jgi:hypothetical protein